MNAAAGGGAQNYNSLLSTLNQLSQAGQQSRMAEEQIGRSGALSGLEQLYQGQQGGLQQQQLQALAELQSNIFSQRLSAEQQAAARNQALRDALAALLGTGYIPGGVTQPVVTQPVVPPQVTQASAALDAIAAGTTPNPGVDALLQLIALSQQDPNRAGGDGGGGGGVPMGNAMVAF